MPGYEIIGKEELAAIKKLFDGQPVLFAHGFDQLRKCYSVRDFEEDLCKKFEVKHALCVSSGTAAIKIALKALGVKSGDEVITQGFNFIATVEAIHDIGAKPVVVAVDDTLNMSPQALERSLTNKTKAIIVVHMLGVPADMDSLSNIARENQVPIIEDACEAVGGFYNGQSAGTLGDIGVYSFDFGKNITTGEGGALVTNNLNLDKFARQYHDHGHMNKEGVPRGMDSIAFPGFNYRMTEISGAIGKVQLSKLDRILADQKKRYLQLEKQLKDHFSLRQIPHKSEPAYDTFIFKVPSKKLREDIVSVLNAQGIGTKNLPDALRWHSAYHWTHLIGRKNVSAIRETHELLSEHIAIPIRIGLRLGDYDRAVKAMLEL